MTKKITAGEAVDKCRFVRYGLFMDKHKLTLISYEHTEKK